MKRPQKHIIVAAMKAKALKVIRAILAGRTGEALRGIKELCEMSVKYRVTLDNIPVVAIIAEWLNEFKAVCFCDSNVPVNIYAKLGYLVSAISFCKYGRPDLVQSRLHQAYPKG